MHGRLRPSGFGAPGRRGGPRRQVECSRDGREDRSAFAAPPCEVSAAGTGTSAKISPRRLAPVWLLRQLASRPALPSLGSRRPLLSFEPPTARAERPLPLRWAACLGTGTAPRPGASATTCGVRRVFILSLHIERDTRETHGTHGSCVCALLSSSRVGLCTSMRDECRVGPLRAPRRACLLRRIAGDVRAHLPPARVKARGRGGPFP